MSTHVAEPTDAITPTLTGVPAPDRQAGETEAGTPQRVARRLLERFALIAFALYHLPLFLNNYPSLGGGGMSDHGLAIRWGHVFARPGMWVVRHVFQMTGPMPQAYQGDNGDVAEEFGRLFLAVVIAAVGAAWWTIADWRRQRSRWVGDALRVLLRYSIALGLTGYAVAKLLPVQFAPLQTFSLEQRVGDMAPMSLLWAFMSYSRPYAFFAGVMEIAVVLLLCFRRTATLGALLCIVVMTNVASMNYAYGVPVKLYATMIVLSAAVLVLYDLRRLLAVFIKNQTAPPAPLAPLFLDRIPVSLRWTIKGLLVGSVLLSSTVAMSAVVGSRGVAAELDGLWRVTSFAYDGDTAGTRDLARWRQLTFFGDRAAIRLVSDSMLFCQPAQPATPGALNFQCAQDHRAELRWTRNGDVLQIDGTFDGTHLTAAAKHVVPSDYRLMKAKFRWMID